VWRGGQGGGDSENGVMSSFFFVRRCECPCVFTGDEPALLFRCRFRTARFFGFFFQREHAIRETISNSNGQTHTHTHTSITHKHHTQASHTSITHKHHTQASHTSITHKHHTPASHTSITHKHHTQASHTRINDKQCSTEKGGRWNRDHEGAHTHTHTHTHRERERERTTPHTPASHSKNKIHSQKHT